ncbi:MAG: hypothetical protein A3J93_03260 [Candidatus Magasanikbacteria bacterium RIFOXYC2_FULL_42_28]|uniref:DUF5673 domain-containing protein n=1 Tax=Candidatus Magasanikbacteria bacterium RIFOXYC2_FULL_42_28 TaxID=1798704 RepID=A0A1F6NUH3_9BACT|nr:MAG: hypothetical protein A3J93_03260 [Candidatus Magasanikbacteria bacterium RIFOXYC2_FULL_42_28]
MPQDILREEVNTGEIVYEWSVKEYEQPERNRRWYIVMGIIGAVMLAFAIISANYLFALLIALFAIILFMHDLVAPLDVPFAITEAGIILGKKFYRFSELESFWMIYDPPTVKNLYFSHSQMMRHRLVVPLLDNDPRPIRDYLNQFIEEDLEQEEEPTDDKLARMFRI